MVSLVFIYYLVGETRQTQKHKEQWQEDFQLNLANWTHVFIIIPPEI